MLSARVKPACCSLPVAAVVLGRPNFCTQSYVYDVGGVSVHPEYRAGEAYADLAVVTLRQPVDLRDYLPLCLHTLHPLHAQHSAPGRRAFTTAWNIRGTCELRACCVPACVLRARVQFSRHSDR